MDRLEGGYLGAKPTWSTSASPGVWTLSQALARRAAGTWPATSFLFDPYFESVSLLLHMNGSNASTTFVDSSLGNLAVTANGNAQISTAQSKFGGSSGSFDGTGDYISVPYSSSFAFGSGDFTVEMWIYRTGVNANSSRLWNAGGDFYSECDISIDSSGALASYGTTNGTSWNAWSAPSIAAIPLNTWTHIALVRSNNTVTMYVNGTGTVLTSTLAGAALTTGTGGASVRTIGGQPGTDRAFPGYIDEVRITRGVARYTANFSVPGNAGSDEGAALYDPYFDYVSLLLRCNGENNSTTFTDSSNSALAIAANGNAKISTAQSKFGGASGTFDGTGDWLAATLGSAIGTGDFTLEAWIYLNSLAASQPIICIGDDLAATGLLLFINTSGRISAFGSNASIATGTTLTIATGTWNHVAISRSGTSIRLFVNGINDGTATNSANLSVATTQIGRELYNSATGAQLNGYIDDLRITKGVCRYTTNFRPVGPYATSGKLVDPYLINTSLLLPMTGDNGNTSFFDRSNNFLRATENGNAKVSTTQSKFEGTSAYLDGNGDYIVIPNAGSSTLNWNSGSYTIEYWIYPITLNQTAHGLPKSAAVGRMNGSNSSDWSFGPISNGTVRFAYYGSGGELGLTTTAAISTNTWSHLAFTHSGGTMTIYINGTKAATGTVSGTPSGSLTDLFIGYSYGTYLNAYIDDMRITPGVVRYGTDFTPPERTFNDEAFNDPHYNAVSLLLHMDGANNSTTFTDSSVNGLTVTANGDAKISTAQSRFSGASASFDGTGDYLSVGANTGFVFNGDFTIECWAYFLSVASNKGIFASSGERFGLIRTASTLYWLGSADINGSSVTLVANRWYHVAASRSGTTLRLFVDGVLAGSGTSSQTPASNTWYIGSDQSNEHLDGYIDELRITKGIARYTSNFMPPTLPFYNTTIPTVDPSFSSVTLLLHMNGADGSTTFTDSSSLNNAVTYTDFQGSVRIRTAQSRFGGASGSATGGWLTLPNSSSFALGLSAQPFTLELWMWPSAAVDGGIIMGTGDGGAQWNHAQGPQYDLAVISSTIKWRWNDNLDATPAVISIPLPTLNQWHHYAVSYNGSITRVFLNGVESGSSTAVYNTPTVAPNRRQIFRGIDTVTFSGYIDELRITKGVARYTSNFYIPRAAFPDA